MKEGRVALVTGAGGGIGRAIVIGLARRGIRVMATDLREEMPAELVEESGVHYFPCSLETADGCASAVAETRERLGPIEILVNNAGIGAAEDGSVLECSFDLWLQMMAINLDAPFHLTRLAARDMVDRGWGRIVMVSSTAGQVGGPDRAAYCSSKHGLLGLMRAAAVDLARYGVTSNAVLPGWVRTGMSQQSAVKEAAQRGVTVEAVWREREAAYPAGRVATAEEVATVIAFLSSDDSSGISGQTITVALGASW